MRPALHDVKCTPIVKGRCGRRCNLAQHAAVSSVVILYVYRRTNVPHTVLHVVVQLGSPCSQLEAMCMQSMLLCSPCACIGCVMVCTATASWIRDPLSGTVTRFILAMGVVLR